MLLTIKAGDTRTAIKATLKNPSGNAVDLTDSTVTFVMEQKGVILINRPAEIVDALSGRVNFVFVNGETDILGGVKAEFIVDYPDGSTETFPNSGYISIRFEQSLT